MSDRERGVQETSLLSSHLSSLYTRRSVYEGRRVGVRRGDSWPFSEW